MSEARFETLAHPLVDAADAAGIGVLVTTDERPSPTVLFASDAACGLLGQSRVALLDSRAPLFEPAGAEDVPAAWPPQFETVVQRADGTAMPLEVSCTTARVDDRDLTTALLVDASERKQAEQALRRQEDRFERLIESAPEGVFIVDASEIVFANPLAAELLGASSADELIGQDPRRFMHADDVPQFNQRARAILGEGRRIAPGEYRVPRSNGDVVFLEISSIAMEHQGSPALLSFARDVTERKHTEAQLLQADRLGALGMLAGGMAHAINNPLTYVLLNLEDVARRLPDVPIGRSPLPEALARLKEAHQGAERIASIVRQMRAFSRPDESQRGSVDLRRVLDAAIAMVGNEIRHRGRLVTSFESVPPVRASSARLEHVFLNLLLQVAQDLPEGEPEGEVRLVLKRDPSGQVVVEISDSGPGIEPAALERAFDPFFSAPDAGARVGLGLALCHSIVTSLGGELQAESEVGQGTTFRVTLPADESALEAPPQSRARGPRLVAAPMRRARVMVVDDDPGVVSALRLMLEDDHDVTSVAHGPEALRMLVREDVFDIVFCDLMMPELSGKDLYESLQLNCPGRERRLVFMTGGAFTPEAAHFLEQVPNPRIEKPFDMDSLRSLLHSATR